MSKNVSTSYGIAHSIGTASSCPSDNCRSATIVLLGHSRTTQSPFRYKFPLILLLLINLISLYCPGFALVLLFPRVYVSERCNAIQPNYIPKTQTTEITACWILKFYVDKLDFKYICNVLAYLNLRYLITRFCI